MYRRSSRATILAIRSTRGSSSCPYSPNAPASIMGRSYRAGTPIMPLGRADAPLLARPFALLCAEWGKGRLALPLLGGIKAHTLREEITHLEYKEITHFGYVLRAAS